MNSFVKQIAVFYIVGYVIISILYFTNNISQDFFTSSIYAGLLNLLNAFSAVKLFDISQQKGGGQSFIIYNLGGLVIRLFLLLIIFVLAIKFLNIDKYAFILVFFIFYFVSLVLEVVFYLKQTKKIT